MQRTAMIFLILIVLFSAGCVTVKLANKVGKRAEGVTLQAPTPNFHKDARTEVDAAWQNHKNGNVISYLSDCGDPTDPPLQQIIGGVLAALADVKIVDESTQMKQDREARLVHAAGKVDGVPTEIELFTFKRNHCIYILSYVGVKKSFEHDRASFTKFVEGFRAP